MKAIVVLFTGGTIGSKQQEEAIHVNETGSYVLMEAYQSQSYCRKDIRIDTLQPLNLLSENMTTDDWRTLAAAIKAVDRSAYSGIIVTHGSDTLAYTAAMLSYLFADIDVPLVLTASNYPIADERSNGVRNFSHSIDFIMDSGLPGVFVVYEDDRQNAQVYLGTRITQCEPFTDQFDSPYGITYGIVSDRQFIWESNEHNPRPDELHPQKPPYEWSPEELKLSSDIVYIKPYPGLNYSYYDFGGGQPRAVLHDLHHSGTASAVDAGPYSLPEFIGRCRDIGIDVFICPIKDRSDALYSSSHALIEAGAIVIENMSMEAAITKLMLAYGFCEDRNEAIKLVTETNLYYENNMVYDGSKSEK